MAPSTMEELAREASGCTRCPLAQGRTQVVFGMGNPDADLVFVGEGPGAEEDRQGLPFVGRSGKLFDQLMFEEMGLTREHCYVMNTVKCRPPGNRDPKPEETTACRSWFDAQMALLAPRVIVTLGNFATRALLGTTEGITKLRGKTYPYGAAAGAVIVPTFHPAAVLRGGGDAMAKVRADLVRAKIALGQGAAMATGSGAA